MILHRSFEGDFIKQPIGTGPFLLDSYEPGARAVLRRRVDYWRSGEDGLPLPYLDQLVYLDLDPKDRVAAMQGGMIDTLIMPRPTDWKALQSAPGLTIKSVSTAQTLLLRMRTDRPPWDDARVRNALKLCQDREKILQVSFQGQGTLALDAHVAPVHPAFCEQPIQPYAPEQARALLAEAGYPDGLSATLTTKNDQGEPEMARALKERAAAGGFRLNLNIVEPASYWQQWTEVDLGITQWFHRPLATMALALGYTADENGEPGEWNETHWLDDEFRSLLRRAEQTLEIDQRREIMCQIETIMQQRGPVGISYWSYAWNIVRSEFHNTQAHPNGYDILHSVWKETG
jgi:peptide/nickel transport system substrate-binding protein